MKKSGPVSIILGSALFVAASFGIFTELRAQQRDRIVLIQPIQVDAGTATLRLSVLHIDWLASEVVVGLQEADSTGEFVKNNPKTLTFTYRGREYTTIINAILADNVTVDKVQEWFLKRLQSEGKLGAGIVQK